MCAGADVIVYILAEEKSLLRKAMVGCEGTCVQHYLILVVQLGNAKPNPFVEDYARANILSTHFLNKIIKGWLISPRTCSHRQGNRLAVLAVRLDANPVSDNLGAN